jgi:uncharacterized delta-60 repeat protein
MKKQLLITIILIFFGFTAFAQPGTIDLTFNTGTGADDFVLDTSIQSDGKIIIGGSFTSYNGIARNRIARLNTDGTLDTTFNPGIGADGIVHTTSIQNDGKIIIGGSFTNFNGSARNRIARLNSNGTLDTTFNPGIGADGVVYTTSIQNDGKIIIGGSFTNFNGSARNRIARLNSIGTLDTNFNPGAGVNGTVITTSIQSDGKIIIGGDFNTYNGITRDGIARLNTSGSLDATFSITTGPSNLIYSVPILSNGKLIVGSFYNKIKGIARLNTNGTFDSTFNIGTGALGRVNSISIQSDGKIIIGGNFFSYNDVPIKNIARLHTDGTLDESFNPGTGANNIVWNTSIQSDGKIIIAGGFTAYNGIGRNRITRINGNNTLSNSSFDKSSIAIYPNPSNGIYTFQTNERNAVKSISIYTILGQKIYDAVISSNKTTIDISNQPKGVYLYKVFGEEGEVKSGKLIIE